MYSQYTGYPGQQQPGQQQPSFMQQQRTGFPGQQQQQQQPQMGMGGMGMMPQATGYPGMSGMGGGIGMGMGAMGMGMQPQQTGFRPQQQQQQAPPQAQNQRQQQAQAQQPQYSFLSQPPPSLGGSDGRNPPQQMQQPMQAQPTGFQPTSNFGQVLRAQATGMPSGGLQPQMTGYPGAMQAQPTGVHDPRLQMMAASFMPSNLSQPFQHGAPSFANPTSAPLPQTFQSLLSNPSVRTPAVPWTLSRQEKKDYDQIFRAWTGGEGGGFIEGGMAQDVFGQSGLGREDLGKIWNLADLNNRGKLNLPEFHVAMGLIYRALNGNDIPDTLPAEMIPPSMRDIDSTVDFVKDLLRNDNSARNAPDINLPGTFQRQQPKDATVYKHDDTRSKGYQSSNRHLDRKQVRYDGEDSSADLDSIKRDLQNSSSVLEKSAKDLAERTEEDDELDQEMDELKYRVRRVKDDIEYVSKGKRTDEKDEERRKLERELLYLMHDRLPELERKQEAREERKRKETRDGIRARDKRNESYGRYDPGQYSDRDRDRGGSFRDREEDRYKNRDRSSDRFDRERRPSREDEYRRPSSPVRDRSPPPAPREASKPPPAPAAPVTKAAPKTASMTPEEKKAFIRQQAQERLQARMRALGMATEEEDTGSGVDNTVQERLDREKKEAEEKAKNAEKEQETREAARKARLESVGGKSFDITPASAPAKSPTGPLKSALKKPSAPPPPPSKGKSSAASTSAKIAPPPPVSRVSSARVTQTTVFREVEDEDEEIKAKEEAHKKAMVERAARLKRMQEEEEAARKEEEEYIKKREASRKPSEAKSTPSASVEAARDVTSTPTPTAASTNPFHRLGQGIAAVASAAVPAASSFNPFHRSNPEESEENKANDSDGDAPPPPPPPPPPAPEPVRATTQAPVARKPAFAPPEEEWDVIGDKDNDSDSSDDEYIGSRAKRENIAKALFGGATPKSPVSPASPAPAAKAEALKKLGGGGDATANRGALFASITGGLKLKKAVTVEKSAMPAGKVIGDAAPPAHISEIPRTYSPVRDLSPSPPPAPAMLSPPVDTSRSANRQSVDWISGLAVDGGRSPGESMPSVPEGAEEDSSDEGHTTHDTVAPAPGPSDAEEYDSTITLLVRSLYPYDGQRDIDLSFRENLILQAHRSKDASSPWWYGTLVKGGQSGWFPSNYVDQLHPKEATALYAYQGTSEEELSFQEGEALSVVESSDPDWWKCTKDGVVYIVPASYLELTFHKAPNPTIAVAEQSSKREVNEAAHAATSTAPALVDAAAYSMQPPASPLPPPEHEGDSESVSSDDSMMSYAGDEEDDAAGKQRRDSERQRVLEAAGLIVSREKPAVPIRKPIRKVSHRAPPPAPSRNRNSAYSTTSIDDSRAGGASLAVPSKPARIAPSPDAYDRYEAVMERSKTAPLSRNRSHSDVRPSSISSGVSPGQAIMNPLKSPSQTSFPNFQSSQKESKLSGFMSRISGVAGTAAPERKSTPMISGPINAVPMDRPQDGDDELAGIGLTWSSLVDQDLLQNISARDRKRQEAIFEFIATESAYVRDLQLVVEVFYRGLLSLLDDSTLTKIFSNVEELLILNTTLLSSLEDRQRACRLFVDQVGDLLAQEMPNISIYTPYCVNQYRAIKLLKDTRDSRPEVADYLLETRQTNPAVRSLDLSSFLLEPMQRLTRYPLLIKQILNYTEQDEEEQMLRLALESAEKVVLEVNESVRETENMERLRLLSEELWLGGEGRLDLTAPTAHMGTRRLLKEGQVTKTKSGRKLQLVLCNDIAVLIESRNLYRMPMPLHEVSAKEGSSRDPTAFQIVQDFRKAGEPIALRATSAKEAAAWIELINGARTAAAAARDRASRDTRRSSGIGY